MVSTYHQQWDEWMYEEDENENEEEDEGEEEEEEDENVNVADADESGYVQQPRQVVDVHDEVLIA